MSTASVKVPGRSLGEWLSEIHREKRTGKLRIALEEAQRELLFLAGDLYLGPEHPAYDAARAWVEESRAASGGSDEGSATSAENANAPPFRQLAGPIISVSGGTDKVDCSFEPGAGQIKIGAVGPLPTRQLIMEYAVWAIDEPGLWHRLGGEKVVMASAAGMEEAMVGLQLDPQEAFLLSRLDPPAKVGELINQLDLGKEQVLRSLCRLQSVGLIERVEPAGSAAKRGDERASLIGRFEESIASSLKQEPLQIDEKEHRELLKNLLSRMGEMTYFELLAVSTQSTDDEIHRAYLELGRMAHPSHARALGLAGKEGAFRVLFERATDAYLTLSDPGRKLDYIEEIGPAAQSLDSGPSAEVRDREKQDMARAHFERALAMAERQDFHSAIQLLEQAVKTDPKIEYLTLLGDCQAENPQWLDRAAASYEEALRLRPRDPSLFSRLGRVHERRGAKDEARRAYRAALAVAPDLETARAGLWRLDGAPPSEQKTTLIERLRNLLRI